MVVMLDWPVAGVTRHRPVGTGAAENNIVRRHECGFDKPNSKCKTATGVSGVAESERGAAIGDAHRRWIESGIFASAAGWLVRPQPAVVMVGLQPAADGCQCRPRHRHMTCKGQMPFAAPPLENRKVGGITVPVWSRRRERDPPGDNPSVGRFQWRKRICG